MSKINAIERKITTLQNKIKINLAIISEHDKQIVELQADNNENLTKILSRINGELQHLEGLNADQINLSLRLHNDNLVKYQNIYNKINTKHILYKEKEANLREISNNHGTMEAEYVRVTRKIKDINTLIDSHDTIDTIEHKIAMCNEKTGKFKTKLDDNNNKIISLSTRREEKLKDIVMLKDKMTCPTCRREVNDYMIFIIIENEVKGIDEELAVCNNNIKLLLNQIEHQDKKYEALRTSKKVITELHSNLNTLNKQLGTITSMRTKKISNIGDKIVRYYRVNTILSNSCDQYKQEIDGLEDAIRKDKDDLENYNKSAELIEERNKILYNIEYNNSQKYVISQKMADVRESTTTLKRDNEKLEDEIRKLYKLMDYLVVLKDICKDDNIKQHAISSFIPYLNKKINEYLAKLVKVLGEGCKPQASS